MWMPPNYTAAFLMLLCSMVCWGSWANSLKMMKGCRFELFYWDYIAGTMAMSLLLAFTLGSNGSAGLPFLADLRNAPNSNLEYAFAGGVVFNAANILLTGAIEVAGLAVAFPLGVGLSIVIGVILSYLITAKNDPVLLFGGVAILLVAVILDAVAFRAYSAQDAQKTSRTGIILCVVAGVGLGMFYPLVAKSGSGPNHPGPYTVGVLFMSGMLLSNFVFNTAVMRRPITGQPPLPLSAYFQLPGRWHLLGFALGGGIWGLGTVFNFTAAATGIVGPATSFALGNGAVMVSVIWGLLLWGEFRGASPYVKRLLTLMFVLFFAGLSSIALSPVITIVH
jgi:glucose uptake protein